MDKTPELLPCPLCGADFKMGQEPHDNGYVAGQYYIYHDYGPLGSAARRCPLTVERHFDTAEEAAAAWNTRPAPAAAETMEASQFWEHNWRQERDLKVKAIEAHREALAREAALNERIAGLERELGAAREHARLHAGDTLSLNNEVETMREHWLEAEARAEAAEQRLTAILETYRAPLREARLSGQVSDKQWLQHLADDPGLEG